MRNFRYPLSMTKKTLATFFRIFISIVILAFLFYQYGNLALAAVSKILSLGGLLLLVFAIILQFGEKFVRIYSFKVLIKKNGVDLNFFNLSDAQWFAIVWPVLEKHLDPQHFQTVSRMSEARRERTRSPDQRAARFEFGLERVLDGLEVFINTRRSAT